MRVRDGANRVLEEEDSGTYERGGLLLPVVSVVRGHSEGRILVAEHKGHTDRIVVRTAPTDTAVSALYCQCALSWDDSYVEDHLSEVTPDKKNSKMVNRYRRNPAQI